MSGEPMREPMRPVSEEVRGVGTQCMVRACAASGLSGSVTRTGFGFGEV